MRTTIIGLLDAGGDLAGHHRPPHVDDAHIRVVQVLGQPLCRDEKIRGHGGILGEVCPKAQLSARIHAAVTDMLPDRTNNRAGVESQEVETFDPAVRASFDYPPPATGDHVDRSAKGPRCFCSPAGPTPGSRPWRNCVWAPAPLMRLSQSQSDAELELAALGRGRSAWRFLAFTTPTTAACRSPPVGTSRFLYALRRSDIGMLRSPLLRRPISTSARTFRPTRSRRQPEEGESRNENESCEFLQGTAEVLHRCSGGCSAVAFAAARLAGINAPAGGVGLRHRALPDDGGRDDGAIEHRQNPLPRRSAR